MTIYNSSSTRNKGRTFEQKERETRQNLATSRYTRDEEQSPTTEENDIHNQGNNVSQRALNYAVSQQLPLFKIKCEPLIKDQVEGTKLINALFTFIHDDFKKMNERCTRPIGQ